jgi:ABC-type sugar transport system ATPase subunit
MTNVLEATGIHKAYGGVVALKGCDFNVAHGTVHALLGENGAGKSTLVKVLTGLVRPDRGSVTLEGEPVGFRDANDAARSGVAVVSQELNLFPDLDVLSNLFLERAPLRAGMFNRRVMTERARPVLDELGLDVSPKTPLGELSLAEQQLVEITRALLTEPRVLILDEPTSALDEAVSARLLKVISVLRDRQVGVVFVSHILEEVMALSDVVTVLRDGEVVEGARPSDELSIESIVSAMVGEHGPSPDVNDLVTPEETRAKRGGEPLRLSAENITAPHSLNGVTLHADQGEIVGLAGVAGAGHRVLLEVIAGLRHATGGTLRLPHSDDDKPPRSLPKAVKRGIAVVSGDRRRGLLFERPIWANVAQVHAVALGHGGVFLRRPLLRERARKRIRDLNIKASSENQAVAMLSGGNQQKVVMAKWIEASPAVMLLDDPTRGVAVGSKVDLHRLLRGACVNSVVLLCSTDIEELVSLCDRVLVFRRGEIVEQLAGESLNRHRLLTAMNADAAPDPEAGPKPTT